MSGKRAPGLWQIITGHLHQEKMHLALAALCMLGYTLTELLAPWPLKIIFDQILLDQPVPESLAPLEGVLQQGKGYAVVVVSAGIVLISACRGLFSYAQIYLTSRVGFGMVYALRRDLFAHLQQLSLSYHTHARSGELLTRVAGDTSVLRDIFTEAALSFVAHILTLIGMLVILFALNWQLSLIVVATLPLLGLALFTIYRRVRMTARRQRRKEGQIASRITETLGLVHLVKAFAREQYEQERFEAESSESMAESLRTARLEAAATRTIEIINALGLWAVVMFGALLVLRGEMTPGAVLIFTAYLSGMYKPLRNLAKLSTQFSRAMVSAERIAEILAEEPEVREGTVPAGQLRGEIDFERVSFGYGTGESVLRDVSFRIEPGQWVALIGASGAGKSTIASLILHFYAPQSGTILIDGVNINDYRRDSLRNEIGVVLQDTVLFGASISENIAYGRPEATMAEIEEAARLAYAHNFIASLPEGYDTIIGERGCTLSGGERQRLCLARAIIKRPSVLILDEPTAAVDAESSALIRQAITQLQQGKTTVVIAHHFTAMESFDQILVLRDGEIVERGTHAELLQQGGYYCELFRLQGLDENIDGAPETVSDQSMRPSSV